MWRVSCAACPPGTSSTVFPGSGDVRPAHDLARAFDSLDPRERYLQAQQGSLVPLRARSRGRVSQHEAPVIQVPRVLNCGRDAYVGVNADDHEILYLAQPQQEIQVGAE